MTALESTGYSSKANFYDIEYDDKFDHRFLTNLITSPDQSILEIPCGSGRNLPVWSSTQNRVVCVDREPAMVESFQKKLNQFHHPHNITAVVGDMCQLNLDETFDLIIVPREAFQLLPKNMSALALSGLRKHLNESGRIIIDTYHFKQSVKAKDCPDYYDPMQTEDRWKFDWTKNTSDGRQITRNRRQHHHDQSRLTIDYLYSQPNCNDIQMTVDFCNYSPRELSQICSSAGLIISDQYSDYNAGPVTKEVGRHIYILNEISNHESKIVSGPTGRLKKTNQDFDNACHSLLLESLTQLPLDDDKLAYFKNYQSSYYNGPFIPGMGAENVLDLVKRYSSGGHILDIGSGPTCGFWLLPTMNVSSVTANDVIPEALSVLEDFVRNGDTPLCYQQVLEMFGLPKSHWKELKDNIRYYALFDAFAPWPKDIIDQKFDLITAFGVYSIAPDKFAYEKALTHSRPFLKGDGRYIGAEWIRKDKTQPGEDGGLLNYLDPQVVAEGLVKAGYEVCKVQEHQISQDAVYDKIITWAAKFN